MATCYRHPTRETGVSCSNCGRPICPDCMTPTPVGMRCPECAREKTEVKTMGSVRSGPDPVVTYVLIALNVIAFVAELASGSAVAERGGGRVISDGALFGPAIAIDHEYWRLVTGGFLHAGIIHILFNMYFLYVLGQQLEEAAGRVRFAVLYLTSLLTGSFGALLLSPDSVTVGASGAVFGLMGGAVVALRARGINPMDSGLGMVILLNLGITFIIPGISIGGHLGGLAGGLIAGYLLFEVGERRRADILALGGCLALAALAVAGSIAVAGGQGISL
ncbi:MAG: rhomboid family intramembrane serine protease [Solirubrobacteraceae bacterium]